MRRATAIIAVLSVLSGCTTVHHCGPTSSESSLAELNESLSTHDATVQLRDGTELRGEDVLVRSDTTYVSVYGRPTNQPPPDVHPQVRVRTADVASITVRRPGRGALWGARTGLLVGAVLGALSGLLAESPTEDTSIGATPIEVGALAYGILGGLLGLLGGVVIGARDVYELSDSPEKPPLGD